MLLGLGLRLGLAPEARHSGATGAEASARGNRGSQSDVCRPGRSPRSRADCQTSSALFSSWASVLRLSRRSPSLPPLASNSDAPARRVLFAAPLLFSWLLQSPMSCIGY